LITIGIIGVVSAMTIPNLINNYKAKKLRTQFLKAYSTISQAIRAMEADDIPITKDAYPYATTYFYKTFFKYLNGVTVCARNKDISGCPSFTYKTEDTANPYYNLNGKQIINPTMLDDGQILLNDGMLLLFEDGGSTLWISVDINGMRSKPNKIGYDVFTWELDNHGKLIPMGAQDTKYQNTACNVKSEGWSCTSRAQSETGYFKWVVKNVK
jgi:type II secretory pathway pseudopilin PulG